MSETPGSTPQSMPEHYTPSWIDDVEIKFATEKEDVYFDIHGIPEHIKSQLIPFQKNSRCIHQKSGLELCLTQCYNTNGPQFQKDNQLWLQRFGFFSDQWRTRCPDGYKLQDLRAKYTDAQLAEAFEYFGKSLVQRAIDYDTFIQRNARTWKVSLKPVMQHDIELMAVSQK